jgi:hypothetical protein
MDIAKILLIFQGCDNDNLIKSMCTVAVPLMGQADFEHEV